MLDQTPTISSDTQQAGVSANSPDSTNLRFESLSRLHLTLPQIRAASIVSSK
jgi:hypothetical protein